ncbi:MAG: hypothetical protein KF774_07370 [Planctomyces sp.]|nr:hypothetical protein [Planctomyces sp.]
MAVQVHEVVLRSEQSFGGKLPPRHVGMLLEELPLALRESVSMAFRNRSSSPGRIPGWLADTADVRFVGHQGGSDTVLYFEAPMLRDAAPEIYAQQSLLPGLDDRPDPGNTAFDLFADVVSDIANFVEDSPHFDSPLLSRVARFRRVINKGPFSEVDIPKRTGSGQEPAKITSATVESAQSLLGRTPESQRVRVVGQLDGLVHSTQRFSILLDNGEKAAGVFPEDQAEYVKQHWGRRVLVLGVAVYRASGRLLRIDADRILPGDQESAVFSRVSPPAPRRLDPSKLRKPQGPKSGVNAIVGRWPGDETDEEIADALERLS